MKKITIHVAAVFVMLISWNAFSKALDLDAFQQCMSRTKQERLTCTVGCGMILQQCYDEGIADIGGRISRLLSQIKSDNGDACTRLAETFLTDAIHMESDVAQRASDTPGWTGSELALKFARQRLDSLQLIRQSCKP